MRTQMQILLAVLAMCTGAVLAADNTIPEDKAVIQFETRLGIVTFEHQMHAGLGITECSTCHADGLSNYNGLEGPHGLHVVGATRFANGGHEDIAERNPDACRACHGQNGEGTVLSRMAVDRVLECEGEEGGVFCGGSSSKLFPKGKMVRCDDCHSNELR